MLRTCTWLIDEYIRLNFCILLFCLIIESCGNGNLAFTSMRQNSVSQLQDFSLHLFVACKVLEC